MTEPRRTKRIIIVGKPVHLKLKDHTTACGLRWVAYSAYDPRDVNCLRCMKTVKYKLKL